MDRRGFAVTVTPLHLVVTWTDGSIRCLSRKTLRIEVSTTPTEVLFNDVGVPWALETALGASSRSDFVAKVKALLARSNEAAAKLWFHQHFPQRRLTARCTAASTAYKPLSANGTAAAWFSTPTAVYAESFNANDDAAGSGVRTIRVKGLDSNLAEVEEVLALTGSSAGTPSTQTFLRINGAEVETVGTDWGGNFSSVYVTSTGPNRHVWIGSSFSSTAYGVGQGTTERYTVPAGYTAYATAAECTSASGSQYVSFMIWSRSSASATEPAVLAWRVENDLPDNVQKRFEAPLVFPAGTDVWVQGKLTSGSTVYFHLALFLVPV